MRMTKWMYQSTQGIMLIHSTADSGSWVKWVNKSGCHVGHGSVPVTRWPMIKLSNWRAPWKNRICSTTMKLRKSPVKPVTRQKTCNKTSCWVLPPEIVMHYAFNVILWTSADIYASCMTISGGRTEQNSNNNIHNFIIVFILTLIISPIFSEKKYQFRIDFKKAILTHHYVNRQSAQTGSKSGLHFSKQCVQFRENSNFLIFISCCLLFRRFISHGYHHDKSHFTLYSSGIPRDCLVHGKPATAIETAILTVC